MQRVIIDKRSINVLLLLSMLCATAQTTHAQTNGMDTASSSDSLKTNILNEVIIKSQYRYARRKGDKYVVSFKGSPFYQDKTLEEGLTICPLLTKTAGGFNILGKESSVIYIDGRPTTLTGENLMAFLNAKSTKEIDCIEIITQPSMKYPMSNKSGIINIRTSAARSLGYMATISEGVVKGKKWGWQTNGIIGVSMRSLNLNLFANYAHLSKKRYSESTYHFADGNNSHEKSNFEQTGQPLTAMLSAEWRTKRNLLGASYSLASLRMDGYADNLTTQNITFRKTTAVHNTNNALQVYNELSLGKSTISMLYSYYNRQNKADNLYHLDTKNQQFDHQKYEVNNLKIDAETRISQAWSLQYGANGNLLDLNTHYAYANWQNHVVYQERCMSLYIATSLDLKNINISGGLKYDYTKQDYVGNKHTYSHIIPNVMVTWEKEWGQVFGGYSMMIEKVPYTNLSVSPQYFSPQSIVVGNAFLRPETQNNFNVGISKGNLNAELFYKRYTNSCMMYSTKKDDVIVNTYRNLRQESQFGMNVNYMVSLSKCLLAKVSWNTYWDIAHISDSEKQQSWNNFISTNWLIKFDKSNKFDININYWALLPQKEHGLEWKYRGNLTVDINYNIVKNKLRATLKFYDIFDDDLARFSRLYDHVTVCQRNHFDNRKVSLTIRYMMSNKRSAKRNRQLDIDNVSRIPVE